MALDVFRAPFGCSAIEVRSVFERATTGICKTYRGLDEDLYMTAEPEAFVKWHAAISPGPNLETRS
jgi:hypothetical protein